MENLKNNGKIKQNLIINQIIIDAAGLHYRELNEKVKHAVSGCNTGKCPQIIINNVLGQRYIGDGIKGEALITVNGIPGNDMAAFMDGPQIEVFGNVQDGIGNTMNSGRIIIHGDCGDILGYSMRGGEIYVKGNVGWRSGIHMKSYLEKFPVIIIGGKAGDFLGEYMAGGIIILLGLNMEKGTPANAKSRKPYYFERFYPKSDGQAAGNYIGTGMHGGAIFLKGDIGEYKFGKEVSRLPLDENDREILKTYISNYCTYFDFDKSKITGQDLKDFIKLVPFSHRPYGKLYSY
jgi:glutamate synthase domain-containing protein 3